MQRSAHWGTYTYNKDERDLVAIGAACGVCTAFKAPVRAPPPAGKAKMANMDTVLFPPSQAWVEALNGSLPHRALC